MGKEANVTERTELDLKRCPYYQLDSAALESQHHKRRICSLLYKSGFEGWKSMGIKHPQFLSPKSSNVAPNIPKFTVYVGIYSPELITLSNEIPQATRSPDGALLGDDDSWANRVRVRVQVRSPRDGSLLKKPKRVVEFVILFKRR
ncbi:hypothetical protein ACH5RR_026898, partial [Cinchona calisaya]